MKTRFKRVICTLGGNQDTNTEDKSQLSASVCKLSVQSTEEVSVCHIEF